MLISSLRFPLEHCVSYANYRQSLSRSSPDWKGVILLVS
jgi:hypothetical protein